MSQALTKELKAYVLEMEADLVGVGSVERLDGAPAIMGLQRAAEMHWRI